MKSRTLWLFLGLVVWAVACGDLPRDPHGTLNHVQGGRVCVGLVENPPWVVRTGGEPAGAEVELVRRLARELAATPDWYWGGEQPHMQALEHFQLDLVIGGITQDTPWHKKIGLTSPYFENRIAVGVPLSMPPPRSLKGLRVAALRGDVTAAYLEKKNAVPVSVGDLAQFNGPIAAPDWLLERMGMAPADIELHTEKHVMTVPPGENAWIKRLDEFLYRERSDIKGLLQGAARR